MRPQAISMSSRSWTVIRTAENKVPNKSDTCWEPCTLTTSGGADATYVGSLMGRLSRISRGQLTREEPPITSTEARALAPRVYWV